MKYFLLVVVLFSGILTGVAQKKKKVEQRAVPKEEVQTQTQPQPQPEAQTEAQPQIDPLTLHYARKYSLATQWNDYATAKDALYDLIVENPGNDSLIFSLAYYYYENQQFASALLISQELLKRQPKSAQYLEMAAVSAEQLGVNEKALQNYESLFLLTNNISTLYKMAFLQYGLKRYDETLINSDIILGKPDAEIPKVYFNDATNKQKEYSMKVPILTLKGLVSLDKGDKAGAKKFFDQALAIAPDFALAKENLAKTK
jgi:tetratricopeptide (TPR) repeat protein